MGSNSSSYSINCMILGKQFHQVNDSNSYRGTHGGPDYKGNKVCFCFFLPFCSQNFLIAPGLLSVTSSV